MHITLSGIIENLIGGFIGGMIATFLIRLSQILQMPKLDIVFTKITGFRKENENLYINLNIKNTRKAMASGCRVFLLKLEKKKGNIFEPLPVKEHLPLQWVTKNEISNTGIEILGKHDRTCDLIYGSKGSKKFKITTTEKSKKAPLAFKSGDYRFTVQAFGQNANIITKRFIMKWNEKFKKKNIKIKEEGDIF